eukprot:gene51230-46654_t
MSLADAFAAVADSPTKGASAVPVKSPLLGKSSPPVPAGGGLPGSSVEVVKAFSSVSATRVELTTGAAYIAFPKEQVPRKQWVARKDLGNLRFGTMPAKAPAPTWCHGSGWEDAWEGDADCEVCGGYGQVDVGANAAHQVQVSDYASMSAEERRAYHSRINDNFQHAANEKKHWREQDHPNWTMDNWTMDEGVVHRVPWVLHSHASGRWAITNQTAYEEEQDRHYLTTHEPHRGSMPHTFRDGEWGQWSTVPETGLCDFTSLPLSFEYFAAAVAPPVAPPPPPGLVLPAIDIAAVDRIYHDTVARAAARLWHPPFVLPDDLSSKAAAEVMLEGVRTGDLKRESAPSSVRALVDRAICDEVRARGRFVLALCLFSDATVVARWGTKVLNMHPVDVKLLGARPPKDSDVQPFGLFPSSVPEGKHPTEAEKQQVSSEFQGCWFATKRMWDNIRAQGLRWGDGIILEPVIFAICVDQPEVCAICGFRGMGTPFPCPHCLQHLIGTAWLLRLMAEDVMHTFPQGLWQGHCRRFLAGDEKIAGILDRDQL